jgi:hypothetical protein
VCVCVCVCVFVLFMLREASDKYRLNSKLPRFVQLGENFFRCDRVFILSSDPFNISRYVINSLSIPVTVTIYFPLTGLKHQFLVRLRLKTLIANLSSCRHLERKWFVYRKAQHVVSQLDIRVS